MQYIQRYQLKPNQAPAFRRWLLESEPALKENAPEGWTYLGTWFTVRGFGRYGCETRWELEDYASLGAGWEDETFHRLAREWTEFTDLAQDGETYLMKSATDVRVFE